MHPSTLAKRGSLLLFLVVIAFYFYGLGHLPLVGPDEPRYAEVAREMYLRHDLITPTLGGHLWFEKPALLYWMMIASFKLFGVSEWSARLGPAVSGLLTILAVFWIGKRAERAGSDGQLSGLSFWSALVTATSLGMIAFSRAASFDIVITMTTTWALAFFIVSECEADAKRRQLLLAGFYVAVGLSLLAKGLVGFVIPFGVVGAYYILRGRAPERITYFSLLWGFPLTMLVAATWYAPMIWRHGAPFIDQFIIQHHFERYVTNKYHHPGPVYYYLLILAGLTLPWTAFLIEGILKGKKWFWRAKDALGKFHVFAIAWLLLPLIFFSFSSSKLPGYILPVLPAVALIAGERLARLNRHPESGKWAIGATAILCLLFAVAVVIYARRSGQMSMQCALLMSVLAGVAGSFALLLVRRQAASILLIACATLVVVIVALYCAVPQFAARESSKYLIQLADSRGYSRAAIFGLRRDDRTPEFYGVGRVVYGADGEPSMYEGPSRVIYESQKRKDVILALVSLNEVDQLTNLESIQTDVIGNNGKVAIVAVRPR